ncbi:MAG: IS1 family transposase [Acidobacteriia bacterium]|nr:IS1 family transposase [Terriglobia bacterium]
MNRLTKDEQVKVISCLVEGNSIRSTSRLTGIARNTITKLLVDVGSACAAYHYKHVRNVNSKRIQCDEIWSFCYAKAANVPEEKQGEFGFGDVWTWTAIDADSKLIVSWLVGDRGAGCAHEFISDLASRLSHRVQLTTDGHRVYLTAVEDAFGSNIDYAMLVKIYGEDRKEETRYSPPKCIGAQAAKIIGNPNPRHISTSYVERQNLTMRMQMRRFTRLTNAFSKKLENHIAAVSLYFMYYNFCRTHQTLRVTPAMEAGILDHIWTVGEILNLLNIETA